MNLRIVRVAAVIGAAACVVAVLLTFTGARKPPGDDPVGVAQDFLVAIKERDCERVWAYFSAASQRRIEAESVRLLQGQQQAGGRAMYADIFAPRQLYCRPTASNRYLAYVPHSVALLQHEENRAVVAVQEAERTDFLLPGFFPTRTVYHDRQLVLVKEARSWRIEHLVAPNLVE